MGATEKILGYSVSTSGKSKCVTEVIAHLTQRQSSRNCQWLACFNPHSYAQALNDPQFSIALRNADWLIPDGSGIVIASKITEGGISERVTGSDIFEGVMGELNRLGGTVFFLGSTEETLFMIRAKVTSDFQNIEVVGTYSPPFKPVFSDEDNTHMIAAINAAMPDVLWVGMTAPKQEKWIHQNLHRLDVRFAAAIGAVFDFYTGRVKRSHPIFQRLGLEWLPRLVQEPRRLWRRMFVSAPIFLWHVLKEKIRH